MTRLFFLLFALVLLSIKSLAQDDGFFSKTMHSQGWDRAIGILFDQQGNQFVWEKKGLVYQYINNTKHSIINISEEVGDWSDAGLLGAQLDPNFVSNGYIYLFYVVDRHHLMHFGSSSYSSTANEPNNATIGRVTRYTLKLETAGTFTCDIGSRKVLLGESRENGIPILYSSHMIGTVAFGTDGTLLLSCGDAAHYGHEDYGSDPETFFQQALNDGILKPSENVGAFRAQLLNSYNGKILRIDPETGLGVSSNPFYDEENPESPRSKVWALGLRNPYRFIIGPDSGSKNPTEGKPGVLYIGDVGMGDYEELNIADKPGINFGWPLYEGLGLHHSYKLKQAYNLDISIQTDSCGIVHPSFADLLLPDKLPRTIPLLNLCGSEVKLDSNLFYFVKRPALGMSHWGPSNVPRHNANGDPYYIDIKHPNAQVKVDAEVVLNDCVVAGDIYTGNTFPEKYKNTFFYADYVNRNIFSVKLDSLYKVKELTSITSRLSPQIDKFIVGLFYNKIEDVFYCIEYTNVISKIKFQDFLPPIAKITSDTVYGSVPLTVKFNASGSVDPDRQEQLEYFFDFGDGNTASGDSVVSHTYEAPLVPKRYRVFLKVTDRDGLSDTTSMNIWTNNTPPNVRITRSHNRYSLEHVSLVRLIATADDHEGGELNYAWEVFLHHDDHNHPEPIVRDTTVNFTIDPLGCGEENYFYRAKLTVTDSLELSTIKEFLFFPDCLRPKRVTASESTSSSELKWTRPRSYPDHYPENYLVIASETDSIVFNPSEVELPMAHADYQAATMLDKVGRVVYFGADTTVNVTGLTDFKRYHFFIYGHASNEWSDSALVTVMPKVYRPTIPASNISITSLDSVRVQFRVTRGDGDMAAAFVLEDASFIPKDFQQYSTAGKHFYVTILNSDSGSINGLRPKTVYTLKISEFNIGSSIPLYLSSDNSVSFETEEIQIITDIENSTDTRDISIFPTTVTHELNINWGRNLRNTEVKGKIVNLQGQTMDEFSFETQLSSHQIHKIKLLPPGVYVVRLIYAGSVATHRIIKK